MVYFEHQAAPQLALDIRSTHQAIHDALATLVTLSFYTIDTFRHSDALPAHTQEAIEGVASSLTKMFDARKGFVSAHRKIAIAQPASNLQEINFGCVAPSPLVQPAGLRVANG